VGTREKWELYIVTGGVMFGILISRCGGKQRKMGAVYCDVRDINIPMWWEAEKDGSCIL
jgi:hypothetical protein